MIPNAALRKTSKGLVAATEAFNLLALNRSFSKQGHNLTFEESPPRNTVHTSADTQFCCFKEGCHEESMAGRAAC